MIHSVGPISSPPPYVARRFPVKSWWLGRALYLRTLLPLRAEMMYSKLTSTGVCDGAVLFCQPNLITSASPVLFSCGQTLAASTLQQGSGVPRSANLRQALWPHMIEESTSYPCRESIRILHAVFEVILPFRRFEHAFVTTIISPTLRSRSPCASWAPPHRGFVRAKPLAFPAPFCP